MCMSMMMSVSDSLDNCVSQCARDEGSQLQLQLM